MIQRLPFQDPATAGDVARLQCLLHQALTRLHFHRVGKIAVLNLACGRADETGALAAALAPMEIDCYFGMDLRADALGEASRRWILPGGHLEFRQGDASSLHKIQELPAFDFIFIRHQNYWFEPVKWDRLLANALRALAPQGLLACTSYFDAEHELLKASLKTRGAELLWDVQHAMARPLREVPNKSVDRRFAIFRKGGLPENLVSARILG